ncbi:sigma-70 family RNA polymerase sigma factor [Robbsia andropogonis]|uniref:RNA polymerase sigma factor n=1 Tax=Robbsia andropogonis TaxID=28092 RepID=UPI003D1F4A09
MVPNLIMDMGVFWSSSTGRNITDALHNQGVQILHQDHLIAEARPAIVFVDCFNVDATTEIEKLRNRTTDQHYLIAAQRAPSAEGVVSLIASGANDVATENDLMNPKAIITRARDHTQLLRFARNGVADFSALQRHADGMRSAVYFKDKNGVYTGCNEVCEKFLAIARNDIRGKTAHDIWPAHLATTYYKADRQLLARGGTQVYIAAVRDGAGVARILRFYKGVVYDESGRISGIVGTIHEIGDKQAYEVARDEVEDIMQHVSTTVYAPHCSPPTVDNESSLLDQVGRGDASALARLYRLYVRRITRFLNRLTWKTEVINEIINDTFMVVWNKAKSFRGDSSVATWITGIAYRCALRSLRYQSRSEFELLDTDTMMSYEPDYELSDLLKKALDLLPEDQRLAMTLAYILGHTVEEISQILGCPATTVKARMHRARNKLRETLETIGNTQCQPAQ